ncbi:hypothetical protein ACQJBY_031633 [Aegilops geniculata]
MESTTSSAGHATGVNSLDEAVAGDRRPRGEDVGREGAMLAALRQVQSPAARASKKRKNRKKRQEAGTSSAAAWPATDGHSWGSIAVVNPRLQDVLSHPGASAPERIYGRRLTRTDRKLHHSRLLMSCKIWRARGETFPLERVLTDAEQAAVKVAEGMQVQAYDRRGRHYDLVCKKLRSNNAYRLVRGWGTFLRANGLVVGKNDGAEVLQPVIRFDLRTFRSPALKMGVDGQQGGPLGLLIMHYPEGDNPAAHAEAGIAEILAAAENAVAMPLPGVAAAVPVLEDAVDAPHEEGAVDAPEEEDAVEADDGGR